MAWLMVSSYIHSKYTFFHILNNRLPTATCVPVYTGMGRKKTIDCFQFNLQYVMLFIGYSLPVDWL